MRVKKENSQEICIRLVKYDKENFQNRKMFLDTENADISQLKIWKMRTSKKKKTNENFLVFVAVAKLINASALGLLGFRINELSSFTFK